MGILQGATELFPVSSLGHGVLVPGWLGWHNLVNSQSHSESFFLAFIVGLHVGTALALIIYYWKTWLDLVRSLGAQSSLVRQRGVRMAWALNDPATDANYRTLFLLVIATIPVGIVGVLFEHKLRVLFVKPLAASIFLTVNGVILAAGEMLRRNRARHAATTTVATLSPLRAVAVGTTQIGALFAGISRSGVTIVSGLRVGMDHEESANFAFLLATPVILLAGLLKIPDLFGPLGNGVRGQALVGALFAAGAAYLSVRFLVRWFTTKTLWPFAIYCLLAGVASIIRFA
jgi:undecaprenyl-diphosphatase